MHILDKILSPSRDRQIDRQRKREREKRGAELIGWIFVWQRIHGSDRERITWIARKTRPRFESLIKRRVTLGLGTMILLPRRRSLTLMSFTCPFGERATRLRFNFDILELVIY